MRIVQYEDARSRAIRRPSKVRRAISMASLALPLPFWVVLWVASGSNHVSSKYCSAGSRTPRAAEGPARACRSALGREGCSSREPSWLSLWKGARVGSRRPQMTTLLGRPIAQRALACHGGPGLALALGRRGDEGPARRRFAPGLTIRRSTSVERAWNAPVRLDFRCGFFIANSDSALRADGVRRVHVNIWTTMPTVTTARAARAT